MLAVVLRALVGATVVLAVLLAVRLERGHAALEVRHTMRGRRLRQARVEALDERAQPDDEAANAADNRERFGGGHQLLSPYLARR